MKDESFLKVTMEFRDRSDYQYFLDMQKNYPIIRSFISEFEFQLRNWRKHDTIPDTFLSSEYPQDKLDKMPHDFELWYYEIKKSCLGDIDLDS